MLSQIKKDLGINITPELYQQIINYFAKLYKGVIPDSYSFEEFAKARLYSSIRQIKRLKKLGLSPKKCLDAGCGIGIFALVANIEGYNFYGYDIDKESVKIAKQLFKLNKISPKKISLNPTIKNLKGKFDLITSFEVVEHLSDMDSYIKKLRKAIVDDGSLFIETPNYMIPYETHYYAFIPPGPRFIKWFFCKLKGATNKSFFDSINFVNKFSLESSLKKFEFTFDNLGDSEWLQQILIKSTPDRSKHLSDFSRIIKKYNLGILVKFLTWLGFYTPLVYLANPKNNKISRLN